MSGEQRLGTQEDVHDFYEKVKEPGWSLTVMGPSDDLMDVPAFSFLAVLVVPSRVIRPREAIRHLALRDRTKLIRLRPGFEVSRLNEGPSFGRCLSVRYAGPMLTAKALSDLGDRMVTLNMNL